MAIIKCPECGHQVSEMAPTCPNCGVQIAGKVTVCPDCGQVYFRDLSLCPGCHRPTNAAGTNSTSATQNVVRPRSVVNPNLNRNSNVSAEAVGTSQVSGASEDKEPKKSYTTYIVAFVIALLICGVGYYYYNDSRHQDEQQAYELAMQSSDPMVIQQYLNEYKDMNPEHRDALQERLAMLQQGDEDWTNAVVSGSRDQLEQYIKSHPDSPHKQEAMNKIDSMDYALASKDKSVDALNKYLQMHPDGSFADEVKTLLESIKSTEVQPEDVQMIKGLFKRFFQSVNSRNEDGMLATVADRLSSFLGRSGAGKSDVSSFLSKIYKSDVTNMNWHILDDYKIEKKPTDDGESEYTVQFTAEQNINRTDASQPTFNRYQISATVSSDGKISGFNMKHLK